MWDSRRTRARWHGLCSISAGTHGNCSENGNFEHLYRSPVEMQLDSVAAEVFERVRAGKVKRVVIDALDDLERCSIDRQRFADFIYALTQWFAVENVTCIMTAELRDLYEIHKVTDEEISNMSDNLVLLGFTMGDEMRRTIRIIRTRGSDHDNRQHFFEINDKGAVVKVEMIAETIERGQRKKDPYKRLAKSIVPSPPHWILTGF